MTQMTKTNFSFRPTASLTAATLADFNATISTESESVTSSAVWSAKAIPHRITVLPVKLLTHCQMPDVGMQNKSPKTSCSRNVL